MAGYGFQVKLQPARNTKTGSHIAVECWLKLLNSVHVYGSLRLSLKNKKQKKRQKKQERDREETHQRWVLVLTLDSSHDHLNLQAIDACPHPLELRKLSLSTFTSKPCPIGSLSSCLDDPFWAALSWFFSPFFFSSFFFYPFCFLWFSFFEKWTDCPIVRIKALESDLRMSILHMILTRSDGQQRYLHRPPDLIGMVHTLKSREISMYRINFWVLSFPPISHSKLYLQIELILKKTKLQLYCTFFFSSSSDFIHPLYVVL